MRVVFLGTPATAVPSLEALLTAGHEIALVVTQPDRPAGRSQAPVASPVKVAAGARGLRVVQPEKVKTEEFLEEISSCRSDVIVVVAYGRILPGAVLRAPGRGAVNVHFSLLPGYRGAAPVQWVLARCEEATGVTTMRMSEGLDEGDILLQQRTVIERDEHAPALAQRLAGIGASLLGQTLERLEAGELEPRPQDHAQATWAPRLTAADGEADLTRTAREVEGRVRGFDPWPGVWVRRSGRRLRFVRARAREDAVTHERPGSVLHLREGELWVACGAGTVLAVREVQPEARRVITAREAVNGRQIRLGDLLDASTNSRHVTG